MTVIDYMYSNFPFRFVMYESLVEFPWKNYFDDILKKFSLIRLLFMIFNKKDLHNYTYGFRVHFVIDEF